MAGTAGKCARCGQRLVGVGIKLKDGTYCTDCYNIRVSELQKEEEAKKEIYDYIKQIFECETLPPSVTSGIDTLINQGKKASGIKGTLWYYYLIMENTPSDSQLDYLYKIINDNYNAARDYVIKARELREKNMTIDINVPAQTVKVKIEHDRKKKLPYKMEDL